MTAVSVALSACGSHPSATTSQLAAESAGGTLKLVIIPPARALDYSTPNKLVKTSAYSKAMGEWDRQRGRVKTAHPIGHMMVALDCGDVSIPLTGQTGSEMNLWSALDGVGASFHLFPGFLEDAATIKPDIDLRRSNGNLAELDFKVTTQMCHHLAGFLAEYKAKGADKRYGGQYRPRRFEGGGCTSFALAFLEVGGLMKRSLYTQAFSRELMIGVGRIADYSDGAGSGYEFGSNLIAHDSTGNLVAWPAAQPVLVQHESIRPLSGWLSAWSDERDAATNISPATQPNVIPWTVYDPAMVFDFIQQTAAAGGGAAMGRTWTAKKDQGATVLETDATDAVAEPYWDVQDDLRVD